MKAYCTQNTDRECRKEDCCLIMKKKTKLIPFNFELYNCGMKAVFDETPIEKKILHIYINPRINKYLVIFENNAFLVEHLYVSDQHLLLVKELEEKTFYVNVYPGEYKESSRCYSSIEKAKYNQATDCSGILKITYTDEDLIK